MAVRAAACLELPPSEVLAMLAANSEALDPQTKPTAEAVAALIEHAALTLALAAQMSRAVEEQGNG